MAKINVNSPVSGCGIHFTRADVRAQLATARGQMSVEQFAEKVGVSWQYLYKMLAGQRPPNTKVLKFVGLRKAETYQRI